MFQMSMCDTCSFEGIEELIASHSADRDKMYATYLALGPQ